MMIEGELVRRFDVGDHVFSAFDKNCEGGTVVQVLNVTPVCVCVAVQHMTNNRAETFWYALSNVFATHDEARRNYQNRMVKAVEARVAVKCQPVDNVSHLHPRRTGKSPSLKKAA